jgi:tetratricopeptide (TPR) repeat protein
LIVARCFWLAPLVAILTLAPCLQGEEKKEPPPAERLEPPEEDEAFKEKEYVFNPLQADKEFRIGRFYFKKGSWKAALLRFTEATRWDPSHAEAWYHLGEAYQRLNDPEHAREAWEKFLEVAPDHKKAKEVRRKLAKKS